MKDHIDVINISSTSSAQLATKINEQLKPNDKVVSVVLSEVRGLLKDFIVVIARNVSKPTIKRVFREENNL